MKFLSLFTALQESAQAHSSEGTPDLQYMLLHHLLDGSELEFEILVGAWKMMSERFV